MKVDAALSEYCYLHLDWPKKFLKSGEFWASHAQNNLPRSSGLTLMILFWFIFTIRGSFYYHCSDKAGTLSNLSEIVADRH
jgi:hypothetical protein